MPRSTIFLGAWRGTPLFLFAALLALTCIRNRPDPPAVPVGPSWVEVDSSYPYRTSASNRKEYGLVYVRFDWGDGDTSPWSGHGETFEMSHSWREGGVFAVRAQAHDDRTEWSEWSAPCSVTTVVPPYPFRLVDSVALDGVELLDAQVLPNGKFVYVTDHDGPMWVVRASDMKIIAQIDLNCGCSSAQVVCSPDGEYVYATEYQFDGVAVVRTRDNVVVDSLMVGSGDEPTGIAVSPDRKQLFVAVADGSSFVVTVRLPDNVVEDTIFMPQTYITSLAVATDGTRLFAGSQDGYVYAIELSDNTINWHTRTWVSPAPGAIVVHPAGDYIYALKYQCVLVLESGTGAIVDSVPLSTNWSSGIAPDGSFLYVTCSINDTTGGVAVVRTSDNQVVRFIAMPGGACDVAPSPDGRHLYVAGDNVLYVFSR